MGPISLPRNRQSQIEFFLPKERGNCPRREISPSRREGTRIAQGETLGSHGGVAEAPRRAARQSPPPLRYDRVCHGPLVHVTALPLRLLHQGPLQFDYAGDRTAFVGLHRRARAATWFQGAHCRRNGGPPSHSALTSFNSADCKCHARNQKRIVSLDARILRPTRF